MDDLWIQPAGFYGNVAPSPSPNVTLFGTIAPLVEWRNCLFQKVLSQFESCSVQETIVTLFELLFRQRIEQTPVRWTQSSKNWL